MKLIIFVQNMEINYGSIVLFVDIVLHKISVVTVKNYIQRCKRMFMFTFSYNLTTEDNPVSMYLPRLKLITSFVLMLKAINPLQELHLCRYIEKRLKIYYFYAAHCINVKC